MQQGIVSQCRGGLARLGTQSTGHQHPPEPSPKALGWCPFPRAVGCSKNCRVRGVLHASSTPGNSGTLEREEEQGRYFPVLFFFFFLPLNIANLSGFNVTFTLHWPRALAVAHTW